jgi:putative flippase GtrA
VYNLHAYWQRLSHSWAARSLAIGPPATVIDLLFSLTLFHLLHVPARWSAMAGVAAGSVFTFFANRFLAFRDKNPALAKPVFRFTVVALVSMLIHGQLVALAVERLHVPFVFAKISADILVFSVGQTLLLRFVVFTPQPRVPDTRKEVPQAQKVSDTSVSAPLDKP